ncbi:tetratricopeptide repeat protein [Ottowia thiooxydans]|uniref:tetratricopeptide repeat protein n=1 Tax=Ottowia thiooxydans TaxID=219182 RepID=UPI0004241664|nr:tetratricopeptide repeat protein [Ottowia thiooxydans]
MTNATTDETEFETFDAHGFAEDVQKEFESLPASQRFSAEQLEVIYGLAYAHAAQEQWEKALPIFAFLAQYGPTRRHYLAGLAQCMRQLDRHEEAKNLYSLMLLLFPDHLEPGLCVAECQLAQGDARAATTTLRQLADIAEENSSLKYRVQALLGRINARSGEASD